jgi:hypothetical protein
MNNQSANLAGMRRHQKLFVGFILCILIGGIVQQVNVGLVNDTHFILQNLLNFFDVNLITGYFNI